MPELLADDALVEAVAWVEQHVHRGGVIHANIDRAHRTYLVVIGDGGYRALSRIEHLDGNARRGR